MMKIIRGWYEYEEWWKLFWVPIICFIIPSILNYIGFDLSKMNNVDNLVTNTKISAEKRKNILDDPDYEYPLRVWKTPERIFKLQKAFLIWSIFFQVTLVLCTIFCYQLSSWLGSVDLKFVKSIFDYIGLSLFLWSSFSVFNISYHSIKHVSDFDMQYESH